MRNGALRARFEQALALVRPTIRTIRWPALIGGAIAGQLVLWAAKGALSRGGAVQLLPLRVSAVLLCLGAAFVLDDEAGATVEPAVASLMLRRSLRLILTVPVVAAAWGAALWTASWLVAWGPATPAVSRSIPVAALALEGGALLAVTLATGVVATRSLGHGKGGVAAGPALLAFLLAVLTLGRYWPLFLESPNDPGWTAAHVRWASILVAGVIVLVVASLDPARRANTYRRRRSPQRHVSARGSARVPLGGKP